MTDPACASMSGIAAAEGVWAVIRSLWGHTSTKQREEVRAALRDLIALAERADELERLVRDREAPTKSGLVTSLMQREEQARREAGQLREALEDYDGVLATAISELHAQARRQYADHAPGELIVRVGDFVEAAKKTRDTHRRLRAALAASHAGEQTPGTDIT